MLEYELEGVSNRLTKRLKKYGVRVIARTPYRYYERAEFVRRLVVGGCILRIETVAFYVLDKGIEQRLRFGDVLKQIQSKGR